MNLSFRKNAGKTAESVNPQVVRLSSEVRELQDIDLRGLMASKSATEESFAEIPLFYFDEPIWACFEADDQKGGDSFRVYMKWGNDADSVGESTVLVAHDVPREALDQFYACWAKADSSLLANFACQFEEVTPDHLNLD